MGDIFQGGVMNSIPFCSVLNLQIVLSLFFFPFCVRGIGFTPGMFRPYGLYFWVGKLEKMGTGFVI